MSKLFKLKFLLITIFFLTSCSQSNSLLDIFNTDKENKESLTKTKRGKETMEKRFSCGENGIEALIDEGWKVVKEYSEEKICSWKSVPSNKNCDMERDKGCKITKPDKIGNETIYLLER